MIFSLGTTFTFCPGRGGASTSASVMILGLVDKTVPSLDFIENLLSPEGSILGVIAGIGLLTLCE